MPRLDINSSLQPFLTTCNERSSLNKATSRETKPSAMQRKQESAEAQEDETRFPAGIPTDGIVLQGTLQQKIMSSGTSTGSPSYRSVRTSL